jgi:GNAT superfamily N-acetyltransferase
MNNARYIKKEELQALLELYTHLHEKDDPLLEQSVIGSLWNQIQSSSLLHYFVVEHEKKLVSSCTLSIIPNLTHGARPYGLIENVVTHTAYRRRGFGTKLLQYALDIAWKEKCYKVMLLTGSKNPGTHKFYQNIGFLHDIKTGYIIK